MELKIVLFPLALLVLVNQVAKSQPTCEDCTRPCPAPCCHASDCPTFVKEHRYDKPAPLPPSVCRNPHNNNLDEHSPSKCDHDIDHKCKIKLVDLKREKHLHHIHIPKANGDNSLNNAFVSKNIEAK